MPRSDPGRVTITEEGRSGSVTCHLEDRTVTGWWEFAGGDALALVHLDLPTGWPPDRRDAFLRWVADEVIRQKCPGHRAELDAGGGWITIR
ncbi:MAG: hypothetical protein AB7N73_09955 [Gemmatimonadales bacterium]